MKNLSKRNKILLAVIVLLELIAMFAVYPGGLIRRETMYSSGGNHAYAYTPPLEMGDRCTQSFTALGDKLIGQSFAVRIESELSEDFVLLYELTSPAGDVLWSEDFTASELRDGGYRKIEMDIRLKKGEVYSYSLSVKSGEGSISVTCTPYPEDFTRGTVSFYADGELLPMQSFNQFVYMQRLNIKNVIFTWIFLWIVGGVIWEFVSSGKGLFEKYTDKISGILKTGKLPRFCLALEILVSVFVFATLTGGAGVDFDEAFSWDIIVNNGVNGILAGTAADVHPPLYYLIVKAFFAIFGESLKVMVWASIVPVILGMCMASVFVYNRWGLGPAFLFNLIYAFAPFMLHYNLNLRMYSWMDLFVLGVVLVAYEMTYECKKRYFAALFVFSILAVYTQYFALLPIVVCYVWLFIIFLRKKDKSSIIGFFIVGFLDVVAYIPWLLYGMKNMGIGAGGPAAEYKYFFKPSVIFEELFASNLEKCDVMAMVLFIISLIIFLLTIERYSKKEKSFIFMLLFNMVFCWYFSQWLGSLNGHFFTSRYVIFCLVFMWLFMAVSYSRCNRSVFVLFLIWALELSLSSYKVEKAYEYDTTPLMPQTVAFIDANVDPDAIIVYDYDRWFNLIWQYYMPGHEFVHFEDLNLDEMKGQTFWVINLSGAYFSQETIDEYSLEIEHNPGMGFMGMERFDLWKVTVGN